MTSLVSSVAAIAGSVPARAAIALDGQTLTYGDLWAQSLAFAAFLRARGVQPNDRLALIMANGPEAVVATYGTWLAGGVIVPLNAMARSREFGAWLSHSGATVLVHDAAHRDIDSAVESLTTPPLRIAVGSPSPSASLAWAECLLEGAASGATARDLDARELDPNSLAMLLYTSGTTGRPKGVMLSHGNLAANVASIVSYLGLTATDSIVTVLPFYYSYGASVLHTHLVVGARVVIESNLVFPHAVVETLARERASGFAGVPSTFALLLSRVKLHDYDLSAMRYLTQAGGAMAPALTTRLREAVPNAVLFVMYGQTEATARLAYLPPEHLDAKLGSVGIGIPGVELVVRREDGKTALTGEVGDVWARGANVMLGYWLDEATTRTVLVDGWLKTGDMGSQDAEGYLYLAGRRSDMIKTGAHRVHPNDVEEVVAELPEVAEVAVVGVEDEVLGQAIKAFVVASGSASPDANRIKAHCRERLALYKIPKVIEIVASLPKTASGKVKRADLVANASKQEFT